MEAFDHVASELLPVRDRLLALPGWIKAQAHDIHCKAGQPLAVCGREGIFYIKESGGFTDGRSFSHCSRLLTITSRQLADLFFHVCGQSVFSHENELRQGYVQMQGVCRVGVCGTAVVEDGRVKSLRDVTSLVFRIPRDCPGCGDRLFLSGVDFDRGVLLGGEPGSGKTTLLRDLARSLSLGRFSRPRRVAVLDSRGELSGFDLGPCADVLRDCPKAEGIQMIIRSLSPEVILCDELSPEDLPAVKGAVQAGVGLVATVHASPEDPVGRPLCRALLESRAFGTMVSLRGRRNPCEVADIRKTGTENIPESRAG